MHQLINLSAGRVTAILLIVGIGLVACNPASSQPAASNGGPGSSSAASAAASSAAASAGGPLPSGGVDVQGSIVSSGAYSATWTWVAGNAADVGSSGVTMTSDKGTFGYVAVIPDGSITFGSGASELSGTYHGTGAQVHLKNVGGVDLACSFTLDNDVTNSDGEVLHLKGSLTIIGTIWNC
jgi:hypothetical protein